MSTNFMQNGLSLEPDAAAEVAMTHFDTDLHVSAEWPTDASEVEASLGGTEVFSTVQPT